MYTNIFYFIIVFSIFSFYEPRVSPSLSGDEVLSYVMLSYLLFYLLNKIMFARLGKKHFAGPEISASFATQHARVINNSSLIAIGIYSIFIYFFDLKYYLLRIPLYKSSEFALNFSGLVIYFAFLVIVWACAFKSYRLIYDASISLRTYIFSHLRLNISLIVPWLIFSIAFDVIKFLPESLLNYLSGNSLPGYLLFMMFFIILACFFPWVLVRIWKCRPLPQGFLRKRLDEFCKSTDFKCSDILLWNLFDGKLVTAGVLGFIKKFRYLLISPSLLKILDEDELESVVAHEVGHVKNHHLIFYIFFVVGYAVFAYAFFNIFFYGILSLDMFFNLFIDEAGSMRNGFYILPVCILVTFLLVYFRFLFGMFSRNFERQADLYAIKISGKGSGLINSLEKIASVGAHRRNAPNWHHFSIQERIDFLTECDANHELIKKHDIKVTRMVSLYFAALVLMALFFYGPVGSVVSQPEQHLLYRIVLKKLQADPVNPALHFILGNIYFEKKDFFNAEKEYLITIDLKPLAPEAMNNLAWLYATADDESFRNPEKALEYSLPAAMLLPEPHILDTLAESYFINGYFNEAVETVKFAISKSPENITYYKKQLRRFEDYLSKEKDLDAEIRFNGNQLSI